MRPLNSGLAEVAALPAGAWVGSRPVREGGDTGLQAKGRGRGGVRLVALCFARAAVTGVKRLRAWSPQRRSLLRGWEAKLNTSERHISGTKPTKQDRGTTKEKTASFWSLHQAPVDTSSGEQAAREQA